MNKQPTSTKLEQGTQTVIQWFIRKYVGASLFLFFGLGAFNSNVAATPIVTYTVTGTTGAYTLDFIVNNTGTLGFDIYLFTVLADGNVSGAPAGYNSTSYATSHYWDIGGTQTGPYNNLWIDPTYTFLPTGATLSGFTVNVTDLTAPTSITFSAFGEDNGRVYTGPGNLNTGNPSNPFFTGIAMEAVPDTSKTMILLGITALGLKMLKKQAKKAA
jgi:hypothetical protein